ncbi:endonuclease/exonuclease/phosphatase family protein [Geminicoccus roseus]|uniref:endonuclease/exonuclease/phosphatase family protein n=1 Tax=Geminicoccus roseus TaxID=404900 RepID=UPI000424FD40|nr:endonuclease/exonuclease/phosphatase family protein [Geminicoccus roseus]
MPSIVTYNVHGCLGVDRKLSPERIADVLAALEPDIVALQELDVGRMRSGGIDQAHAIAQRLGMKMHFHPAVSVLEEHYGDAILTALPVRLVKAGPLPGLTARPLLEPRGALWVEVDLEGHRLQVLNTHLGLIGRERVAQVDALLGPDWLGHPDCREPVILTGDFNAPPPTAAYRRLRARLGEAQNGQPGRRQATFPGRFPLLCLDHVFHAGPIAIDRARTIRTPLARIASDHLPLAVDFRITAAPALPRDAHALGAIDALSR